MATVPHKMVGLERMLDYRGVGLQSQRLERMLDCRDFIVSIYHHGNFVNNLWLFPS